MRYSHSTTKCVATDLQQRNIQKTKTILLQRKNPLFATQLIIKLYLIENKEVTLFV